MLHTNGQDLTFHPHVHCIVTGGGLSKAEKWVKEKRQIGNFLFPTPIAIGRAMEKIYKGYFLEKLLMLYSNEKSKIEDKTFFENLIQQVGFMSHQHKGKRLAMICEQLNIAAPPPKVKLPVSVLAATKYGVDITQCSVCKEGKLELVATCINIAKEGVHLVNADELHSRGSPRKIPIAV